MCPGHTASEWEAEFQSCPWTLPGRGHSTRPCMGSWIPIPSLGPPWLWPLDWAVRVCTLHSLRLDFVFPRCVFLSLGSLVSSITPAFLRGG